MSDTARRGVSPPGWLLAVALLWPTVYTWLYFVTFAGQPAGVTIYTAGKLAQFALPVVACAVGLFAWPRFTSPRRGDIALGLAVGAALGMVIGAFLYFVIAAGPLGARIAGVIVDKLSGFGISTPGAFSAMAAFYSGFHSLLEEYYWRWFVQGGLERRVSFPLALTIASVGFVGHHVVVIGEFLHGYGPLVWFAGLSVGVGGAIFGWLYRRSGALYAPWLCHLLLDVALMTVGYVLWSNASG